MRSMRSMLVAALAAGCASTGPVAPPTVTTSSPAALDPQADVVNLAVAASTAPAIIVSVTIDDRRITLDQATLASVPERKRRERRREGETVTFEGMRGADVVSSVTVSDQSLNVEEQKGLVRLTRRSLQVAVPAPRAIDAVRVTVHANGATETLRLDPTLYRMCEAVPSEPFCRDVPRQR